MESKKIIGERFGILVVLEYLGLIDIGRQRSTLVKCRCDCGNIVNVSLSRIKQGYQKSCGCLLKNHQKQFPNNYSPAKHGYYHHELYHTWFGMIGRCYDDRVEAYSAYGKRGICVCDEWKHDYIIFYSWAIKNGYEKGLTLERKNNNGNYEPSNCKWATRREQANNRRTTHYVKLHGDSMSMADACRLLKLNYKIINQRVKRDGLSFEEAILIPINK